MPALADLAAFIERLTQAHAFAEQPPAVWAPSSRTVARLGLALEPSAEVARRAGELDALFLHRPWRAEEAGIRGVGILTSHLGFDERLTVGFNPELAEALGVGAIEVLGTKEGRPLGMIGDFAGGFAALAERIADAFGAPEATEPGSGAPVRRVAAVGAMTDALVREAAERGAGVYVTGQMRAPARRAVADTGMAVVAVGHRRSEVWGLHLLARLLREEWPGLDAEVLDAP
jgi:putative NIF3 family GTP cyclohydrolase 1 type 2